MVAGPRTFYPKLYRFWDDHPVAELARERLLNEEMTLIQSRITGKFFIAEWLNRDMFRGRELPASADTPTGFKPSDWTALMEIGSPRHRRWVQQQAAEDYQSLHRYAMERQDRTRDREDRAKHLKRAGEKRGLHLRWDKLALFL